MAISSSPFTEITYLYQLRDSLTGEIKYGGKANCPQRRLAGHLKEKENNRKTGWLKNLAKRGGHPILEVVKVVPMANWEKEETRFLEILRSQGHPIMNMKQGGRGEGPYYRRVLTYAKRGEMSEEAKTIRRLAALKSKKIQATRGVPCHPNSRGASAAVRTKYSLDFLEEFKISQRTMGRRAIQAHFGLTDGQYNWIIARLRGKREAA